MISKFIHNVLEIVEIINNLKALRELVNISLILLNTRTHRRLEGVGACQLVDELLSNSERAAIQFSVNNWDWDILFFLLLNGWQSSRIMKTFFALALTLTVFDTEESCRPHRARRKKLKASKHERISDALLCFPTQSTKQRKKAVVLWFSFGAVGWGRAVDDCKWWNTTNFHQFKARLSMSASISYISWMMTSKSSLQSRLEIL